MRIPFYLFSLIFFPLIVACSSPTEPVDREPYITGIITEIENNNILIEEDPTVNEPLEPGGTKIRLTVSDETKLFMQDSSGSLSKINFTDLELNHEVKGWAEGAITDSYPQQGLAEQIILLR